MNVLFVCSANENRSQIAEAIFNRLSKKNKARSAGIKAIMAGWYVRQGPNNPVIPMNEEGYDISHAKMKQLDANMAKWADKIVVIFNWKKHEKEIPEYLRNHPDREVWEIDSISEEMPFEEYSKLEKVRIKEIERRVKKLVKRIG